jgi:hypothetical protein
VAWTTPTTAVSNTALTAAVWNATVRDNLNETAPAKATAIGTIFVGTGANSIAQRTVTYGQVAASESTATTTYTALTTAGPSVSITTSTNALVFISAQLSQSTSSAFACMSQAVSGASSIAATDTEALMFQAGAASSSGIRASTVIALTSQLTSGSNVFTAQYRASAGTATFGNRRLAVIGL